MRQHFVSSILVTILGLALSAFLGWRGNSANPLHGAIGGVMACGILAVLEISLSFDNALINASVIRRMTPKWQRRFLTWGMAIAVFGMRLIFPLALVGVIAQVNPLSALLMAVQEPDRYAELMRSAHIPVVGFGGSFLLMVALRYFLDHQKEVHWLGALEAPLAKLGHVRAIEALVALIVIVALTLVLKRTHPEESLTFILAAVGGVLAHLSLELLNALVHSDSSLPRASAALFVYLEVQDASFSFDGVVSSFAITHNLFLITIGLGIGAMFVRALTLTMVKHRTLENYKYLESGAFYAIGALSFTMLCDTLVDIPDFVAGFLSVGILGASFWASRREPS